MFGELVVKYNVRIRIVEERRESGGQNAQLPVSCLMSSCSSPKFCTDLIVESERNYGFNHNTNVDMVRGFGSLDEV